MLFYFVFLTESNETTELLHSIVDDSNIGSVYLHSYFMYTITWLNVYIFKELFGIVFDNCYNIYFLRAILHIIFLLSRYEKFSVFYFCYINILSFL